MTEVSVDHFKDILSSETKNLNQLVERWSNILDQRVGVEDAESEEYSGAIRLAVGQAKLLMSQRFKQFSDLITDCEKKTGQHLTKLSDLSGFWEMIQIQVEDVLKKFKSLESFNEIQ